MIKPAFLSALALAIALPAAADTVTETTEHADIAANVVADGLSHPWGMDILPDGALIVTEREGALRIVRDGAVSDPVAGLPDIAVVGQGGLLDVALAPDFADTGEIYLTFSDPGEGGQGTALARAVLEGWQDGVAELADLEPLFSMEKKTGAGHHFGSRIVFAGDGTVFVTTGDRGDSDRAVSRVIVDNCKILGAAGGAKAIDQSVDQFDRGSGASKATDHKLYAIGDIRNRVSEAGRCFVHQDPP